MLGEKELYTNMNSIQNKNENGQGIPLPLQKETKFSIITVCKNAEKSIERTMLSVVTQTYQNIEYIIVDGASTDGTVEIIKRYAGKYSFIKWISEPDTGIYQAMNKGIRMATGDFLNFLNAGDYFVHYNVLGLVENNLDEGLDVIYGNCFSINPFTGLGNIWIAPENPDKYFFYISSLPHQSVFYKKELFDDYGLYDESFKIVSDWCFNLKVFCNSSVLKKHLDMVISIYSLDGISSRDNETHKREREIHIKKNFSKEEIEGFEKQIFDDYQKKINYKKISLKRFVAKLFRMFFCLK